MNALQSCDFAHSTKSGIPADIFNWKRYLEKKLTINTCPAMGAFNDNIPLPKVWSTRVKGFYIEFSLMSNNKIWYYKVEDTLGYYLLISPLGDPQTQIWIHLMCPHYRGFSWQNKQMRRNFKLQPPFPASEKLIEKLILQLHDCREIGDKFRPDLLSRMSNHAEKICQFKPGNLVEVVDKNYFGSMRQAFVKSVTACGHLMELYYRPLKKKFLTNGVTCAQMMQKDDNLIDNTFWVTPFSSLIHPVGWAKEVGHIQDLPCECSCVPRHPSEPGKSFHVTQFPVPSPKPGNLRIRKLMKLELVDPLSLNVITVGTVVKVLKHDFLMVAVDGKQCELPRAEEHFCVPSNSPYLLPMGFCDKYKTQLKAPPHFRGKFLWPDYLFVSGAAGVPEECFTDYVALNRGKPRLAVGNKIETVDLLNPSCILPATITAVAGHLIRVNFDSWPSSQDQWKYMYGDDIFPIGFCELVQYPLMPPKKYLNKDSAKQFGVVFEEVEVPEGDCEDLKEDMDLNETEDDPLKGSKVDEELRGESSSLMNESNKENVPRAAEICN